MTYVTSFASNLERSICRKRETDATSEGTSRRFFVGLSALLFVASAALTINWSISMSAMTGMPMRGGWTMSMMWMRMPGQTWFDAGASFLGMWVVMIAAMMLPSQAPTLWRYCQAIRPKCESRRGSLTLIAALGYFFVWALLGLAMFPLGAALATIEMDQPSVARVVPVTAGVVMVIAGAIQLTPWKMQRLARCRVVMAGDQLLCAEARAAWRQGLRFGVECALSCGNLTATLFAVGLMDLSAMAAVTFAITAERLAPAGKGAARVIGLVVIVAGLFVIGQAAGR